MLANRGDELRLAVTTVRDGAELPRERIGSTALRFINVDSVHAAFVQVELVLQRLTLGPNLGAHRLECGHDVRGYVHSARMQSSAQCTMHTDLSSTAIQMDRTML